MAQNGFYDALIPQRDFAGLARAERFTPVPDGWVVGATDIVNSTAQIAAGRYKLVNTVGASVISAMLNALSGRAFPFVFGGDGASFAVPAEDEATARRTLAGLRRWVSEEFAIDLRAAIVPVADIRAAGYDLRVARHAASDGVDYAMFAGGGMAWAETRMKAGDYAIAPAPGADPPDLTGLSCRWSNIAARNGTILSLLVLPGRDAEGFSDTVERLLALTAKLRRGGHPVPEDGPAPRFSSPGLTIEAHVSRGRRPLWLRRIGVLASTLLAWGLFRTGLRANGFDPAHYRAAVGRNTDFRKFDDGLKMTLDCDLPTRDRLLGLLRAAQAAGHVRFGLHEQQEAMVTCIVPSVRREDHVHFVDGADGGYAVAASRIKAEPTGR
ncbi:MAG: DUF3095 domain-containing protein [Rhodobacteraceae bacterium]|nr:DUF3095 domain-containing protein [Paracoccaceae bacterium]